MKPHCILAGVALAAAPALAADPAMPDPAIAALLAEISPARLEATVRKLASFGTRDTMSDTIRIRAGSAPRAAGSRATLEGCGAPGGRMQVAFDGSPSSRTRTWHLPCA